MQPGEAVLFRLLRQQCLYLSTRTRLQQCVPLSVGLYLPEWHVRGHDHYEHDHYEHDHYEHDHHDPDVSPWWLYLPEQLTVLLRFVLHRNRRCSNLLSNWHRLPQQWHVRNSLY